MKTYTVVMHPHSFFVRWPTSDTLFGALCWAYRQIYGKGRFERWLQEFQERPKFILSSVFPCLVRDKNWVFFFPKPILPTLSPGKIQKIARESNRLACKSVKEANKYKFNKQVFEIGEKKDIWKKIKWVSESIFRNVVKAEWSTEDIIERLNKREIEGIGNLLITTEERKKIILKGVENVFSIVDIQRNQIDRLTGTTAEGMLFFVSEFHFFIGLTKLWFLVKTDKIESLVPLLRYLEDTGIGGERSVGKGHFRLEIRKEEVLEIPQLEEVNALVCLSRYIPDKTELNFVKHLSFWNLLNLRSKKDTMFGESKRIWKSIIRCFEEGSILSFGDKANKKEYYGCLAFTGISEPYKVYHNGFTIPIFTKIEV